MYSSGSNFVIVSVFHVPLHLFSCYLHTLAMPALHSLRLAAEQGSSACSHYSFCASIDGCGKTWPSQTCNLSFKFDEAYGNQTSAVRYDPASRFGAGNALFPLADADIWLKTSVCIALVTRESSHGELAGSPTSGQQPLDDNTRCHVCAGCIYQSVYSASSRKIRVPNT